MCRRHGSCLGWRLDASFKGTVLPFIQALTPKEEEEDAHPHMHMRDLDSYQHAANAQEEGEIFAMCL